MRQCRVYTGAASVIYCIVAVSLQCIILAKYVSAAITFVLLPAVQAVEEQLGPASSKPVDVNHGATHINSSLGCLSVYSPGAL